MSTEANTSAGSTTPAEGPLAASTITGASARLAEKWSVSEEGVSDDAPRDEADTADERVEHLEAGDTSEHGTEDQLQEGLEEGGEDDGGVAYFTSIDDISDAAGYGKNEFMQHMHVPVRDPATGESREVNLHELVQGYQRGTRHSEEMGQVEQARAQLQQQDSQLRQQWQQRFDTFKGDTAVATAYLEDQEKAVDEHFQSVDWDRVRAENPGEFAALQTNWQQAKDQIQQARTKLREEYVAAATQHQRMVQEQRQTYIREQQAELVRRRPEWRDEGKRKADGAAIAEYLATSYAATPDELANMYDARYLDIAWKAMQYDKAKKGAADTTKSVQTQGGLLRPGAGRARATGRPTLQRRASESRSRLQRSGKQHDAVAALSDRWQAADKR